jgi:hypothetical protein
MEANMSRLATRFSMVLALCLALGCEQKATEEDEDIAPTINGVITLLDEWEGEAAFEVSRAFSYNVDDQLIAYLSSNTATTCEDVAAYLSNTHPLDKAALMRAGTCAMTVVLKGLYGYDGDFSATGPDEYGGPGAAVSSVIECAMGEGEFALESRDDGEDYYWTGRWWKGVPLDYEWTITGGDGDITTIAVDMRDYKGGLPYDAVYDNVFGSGDVTGAVEAQWCPDLSESNLLD